MTAFDCGSSVTRQVGGEFFGGAGEFHRLAVGRRGELDMQLVEREELLVALLDRHGRKFGASYIIIDASGSVEPSAGSVRPVMEAPAMAKVMPSSVVE